MAEFSPPPKEPHVIPFVRSQFTHRDPLACPFYMYNKEKYNECLKYHLRRIRDVKQHLVRRHSRPPYCPRCFAIFSNEIGRDEHTREMRCSEKHVKVPEGLSEAHRRALARKTPFSYDIAQQWFGIWEMLFPGEPQPTTITHPEVSSRGTTGPFIENSLDDVVPVATPIQDSAIPKLPHLGPDSGYGSAARPHSINISSVRDDHDNHIDRQPLDHSLHASNKAGSIASDPDEIGSQVSVETSIDEMTGKTLIGLGLSEDVHFRDICEEVLGHCGQERFVDHLRISLKAFHRNLREDTANEAQMATANLLRSRSGRLRISNQIVARLDSLQEEPDTRLSQGSIDRVEAWLAGLQGNKNVYVSEVPTGVDANVENDMSESDEDEGSLPQNAAQLKKAILGTRAFQLLIKDLTVILLPTSLRNVLTSIPKEDIDLTASQNSNWVNTSEVVFTNLTGTDWNWWPLTAPRRPLRAGEARLSWRCVCGTTQWSKVTREHRDIIYRILELPQKRDLPPYPCLVKPHRFKPIACPDASSAAQRYAPTTDSELLTSSPGQAALANNRIDRALGTQVLKNTEDSGPPHVAHSTSSNYMPKLAYVLFGTYGSRKTFTPSQVRIHGSSTNMIFFRDLRQCFKKSRGFFRYWFSIWQIQNCFVAKYDRLTYERMVYDKKELPHDLVYMYTPRAGDKNVDNPPISTHLFETMYYACDSHCRWPSFLHDCSYDLPINSRLIHGTALIERIPKRHSCFEHDDTPEVWGLQSVLVPSVLGVMIYHVLWVLGPLAFWCWWLDQNPGDWQSASVPVTVIVGGISAFWGCIAAFGLGGEKVPS